MRKLALLVACAALAGFALGCARPKEEGAGKQDQAKAQYQSPKVEEYPVPEPLKQALPGLVNDKIRIYKEISPTVNLVAYFPDYSLDKAVNAASQAFLVLLENPAFKAGVDFWIIQVQPEKGPGVLVWGVKPSEAEAFAKSRDLKAFFADSEYVLINDQIIDKGEPRLKYLATSK